MDITDGTFNTILFVEAGRAVPWTKSEDIPFENDKPVPRLGRWFDLGFHVVFCDGSIHFLSNRANPEIFRALITGNDGIVINGDDLLRAGFSTTAQGLSPYFARRAVAARRGAACDGRRRLCDSAPAATGTTIGFRPRPTRERPASGRAEPALRARSSVALFSPSRARWSTRNVSASIESAV